VNTEYSIAKISMKAGSAIDIFTPVQVLPAAISPNKVKAI
jgi:hypothetical protein